MIPWICFGTMSLLVVALGIAFKVSISAKNEKIDALNNKVAATEDEAARNRLAYDLVVKNREDNKAVEEVVNECKETVEEAAKGADSDWYNERLPDGVRDVFIECVCSIDDPQNSALRNPKCSGETGDQQGHD